MAVYTTISNFFVDLCDILRDKLGTTEKIKHSEIPSKLQNIYKTPIKKFTNAMQSTYKEKGVQSLIEDVNNYLLENPYGVHDCSDMFYKSEDLTEFSGFNKKLLSSNIARMFSNCSNLTSVNLNNLINLSSSTRGMFMNCKELETIDVSKLNMGNVTDAQSMFDGCSKLKDIDISKWDTSKLQKTYWMFAECESLTSVENILKYIDFSNLWSNEFCMYMFQDCTSLKSISMPSIINNGEKRACMAQMFKGCKNLEHIDLSLLDFNKVENIYGMFIGCDKITSINFLYDCNFKIEKEEALPINIGSLFSECNGLISIDLNLSNLNISNVSDFNMNAMFYNCKNLISAKLHGSLINKVENYTLDNYFEDCINLETLCVSDLNISNCTSIKEIFSNCKKLSTIEGVSNLDASKLIDVTGAFSNCINLEEIDLSGWSAINIEECENLFNNCENLISVNLSNFSLKSEYYSYNFKTITDSIFNNCLKLENVNLSNVIFSDLRQFYITNDIFPNLKILNISNVKGISPSTIYSIITHNTLEEIDISDIDFSKAVGQRTITGMFYNCPNLKKVKIKNLSMKQYNRSTSPFKIIKLFDADCYQNVILDFQNTTFCPNYSGNLDVYTLDLTGIWRGTDEEKIACFEFFANSLGINDTTRTRTIKIYSELYNILTEEQKALITNKNYTLS